MSANKHRVYPPIFLLATVLLMGALHVLWPLATITHPALDYAGGAIVLTGFLMLLLTARRFHKTGTTIKPFETSTHLLTTGLYRISRNPIYLGMVVALIGVAMSLGSVTPPLLIPVFALFIQWRFIRAEEAGLDETFGDAYREYRERVRRWI